MHTTEAAPWQEEQRRRLTEVNDRKWAEEQRKRLEQRAAEEGQRLLTEIHEQKTSEEQRRRQAEANEQKVLEEQQRRRAEERRRQLAEADAKRIAEERRRQLAEADAKRIAEERQKRLAWENLQARLAESNKKRQEDAYALEALFAGIPSPDHCLDRLLQEWSRPEGLVRARWVARLIRECRFAPEEIDIEVPAGAGGAATGARVFADIVAYRERDRIRAYMVIETKAPGIKLDKGIKQAESYARQLGAEFFVCTNGSDVRIFRTGERVGEATPLTSLPSRPGPKG